MKIEAIKIVRCHLKTFTKHFYLNFIIFENFIIEWRKKKPNYLLGKLLTSLAATSYTKFSFIKIVTPLLYTMFINELFQLNLNMQKYEKRNVDIKYFETLPQSALFYFSAIDNKVICPKYSMMRINEPCQFLF